MVKMWSSWSSTIPCIRLSEEDARILDVEDTEEVEIPGKAADLETFLQDRYPFTFFSPFMFSTINIKAENGREFGLIMAVVKGEPAQWCLIFSVDVNSGSVHIPKEGAIRQALESLRLPAPGSCKRLI